MKILIVKTSAIGDVTHTLPALLALRRHFPDSHITWLVEEAAADIIIGHPAVDRILVSRRKSWVKALKGPHKIWVFREIRQFVKELRDTEYDLILDFQNLLKSSVLIWLARSERKVGFGRGMEHSEMSHLFLNERVPAVDMNIHAVDRELLLLDALGIPGKNVGYDLPVDAESSRQAKDLLESCGIDDNAEFVAINPVATWETKLWPEERFAELANALHARGTAVVFTGSLTDAPAVNAIIGKMKKPGVNLCGRTNLKILAALFKRADLVISTDTGPMHIAAAVGATVVALFGPTSCRRTGPYGHGHRIIQSDLSCVPCFKRSCATGRCMKNISVAQVLSATEKVWSDVR